MRCVALLVTVCVLVGVESRFAIDGIETITLRRDENWKFGFLTPKEGQMDGSDRPAGNVIIYDFKGDKAMEQQKWRILLIFQEYYHHYEVMVCFTNGKHQMTAKDAFTRGIPIRHNRSSTRLPTGCRWINPIENPVYETQGPIFLRLYRQSKFNHVAERVHMIEKGERILYNITYEMRVGSSHINKTLVWDRDPCSLNGRPVLYIKTDSWYEFICNCTAGTKGQTCQWGKDCNPETSRSLCNNHGSCSFVSNNVEDSYTCICDPDYVGFSCTHFSAFPVSFGCGRNSSCSFCHQLLNGEKKCSCSLGLKMSPHGGCVKDTSDVILKYEIPQTSSITKFKVASKIQSIFSCAADICSTHLVERITIDEKSQLILLKEISHPSFEQLAIRSVWEGTQSRACPKKHCDDGGSGGNTTDLSPWTGATLSESDGELKLSLIRVQYSKTAVKRFNHEYSEEDKSLKLCCQVMSDQYLITFFRENNIINEHPFNLSEPLAADEWVQGGIRREAYPSSRVCLNFEKVTEADDGVYKCRVEAEFHLEEKERVVEIRKTDLKVLLEPGTLMVREGGNVTVNCTARHKSFWTRHPILTLISNPRTSFERDVTYPFHARGKSLTVYNVQKDLNVTCIARDGLSYDEKIVFVYVVSSADTVCEQEFAFGMEWHLTKAGSLSTSKCPKGYQGHCQRACMKEPNKLAAWQLPDCSECQKRDLGIIFKNLTLYNRGIPSYLPNPEHILRDIKATLSKHDVILPGEMSSVIRVMSDSLLDSSIQFSFEDFYSLLSFIISERNSITEKYFVTLEKLVARLPEKYMPERCLMKVAEEPALIGYARLAVADASPYNISFSLGQVTHSSNAKRFSRNTFPLNSNQRRIEVVLHDVGKRAKMLSVTIYVRPKLFFPHLKRVIGRKEFSAQNQAFDDPYSSARFGSPQSPFVQAAFYEIEPKSGLKLEEDRVSIVFSPCIFGNDGHNLWLERKQLHCGRYLPYMNLWNTTGCSYSSLNLGRCSCSCVGLSGWIGIVEVKNGNSTETRNGNWSANIAVATGCMLSVIALSLTVVILLIRCGGLYSTALLARAIEVMALGVTNIVFFNCALVRAEQANYMMYLVIVSGTLVLTLGISVSHQVDILHRYSLRTNSAHRAAACTQPSFLLTIVSSLISVILGGILYTIAKVKGISLSHAWLPESEEASSLSLVVLCYISSMFLLVCILVALNWLKLRSRYIVMPPYLVDSLNLELKRHCVLTALKFAFIMTSIYQETSAGKFLFMTTAICLGLCFLVFYTCESFMKSTTAESVSEFEEANVNKRRKMDSFKSCFLGWLCSSAVVYSGVAETDTSHVPNESSVEGKRKIESTLFRLSDGREGETSEHFMRYKNGSCHIVTHRGSAESAADIRDGGLVHLNDHDNHTDTMDDQNSALRGEKIVFTDNNNCRDEQNPLNMAHGSHCDRYRMKCTQDKHNKNILEILKEHPHQSIGHLYLRSDSHRPVSERPYFISYAATKGAIRDDTNVSILYENFPTCKRASVNPIEQNRERSFVNDNATNLPEFLNFDFLPVSQLKRNTGIQTSTLTFPRCDKRKNILSSFSSKISLLGAKTRRAHKNFSSGKASESSDSFERSILINGETKDWFGKKVSSQDSILKGREYYSAHRRQHSF